ncbi:MAG: DUF2764 domain-containing protein [Tannerellaceae bacterium]|jgi:hypothetical protein|nr:DUF2764 domain-containing protein [Tannerellaceae bacterium]
MSKYYYLIAGLPNIAFEDSKLPYTVSGFKEELGNYLSRADRQWLNVFTLKFDNENLLEQMQHPGYEPDARGRFTYEELKLLLTGIRNGKEEETPFKNRNKHFPPYFETFAHSFLAEEEKTDSPVFPWEDRLSALYYAHAMKSKNDFVAGWFELNLNIKNILIALTCRKYKLDKSACIVGENETARKIRTSNARDFDLGDSLEYLPAVLRIAEENDLLQRERKIDLLKWEWLEETTLWKTFDIENVLVYLLKLEILERWTTLDKETGEQSFRQLVGAMKKSSGSALEEFKRNNKK